MLSIYAVTSDSFHFSIKHFFQGPEYGLQPFQIGDDLTGCFLIVPEVGRGHPLLDLRRLALFASVVKESLAVGESAAEWPRPDRLARVP